MCRSSRPRIDCQKVDGDPIDTHSVYWHRDTPKKVRQELMLRKRVSSFSFPPGHMRTQSNLMFVSPLLVTS